MTTTMMAMVNCNKFLLKRDGQMLGVTGHHGKPRV